MSIKKWVSIWFVGVLLVTIITVFYNYTVDRYSIFKKEYRGISEPNQNFLKMDYLIHNNHGFDSFIFGSSRVGKIDPTNIPGGSYYNLSYSEGVPYEHLQNIKLLIRNKVNIKNILIGLDDFSYQVNPTLHRYQPLRLPHYETDSSALGEFSFFFYYLTLMPSIIDFKAFMCKYLIKDCIWGGDYDLYGTGLPVVPVRIDEYIESNTNIHNKDKKFLKPTLYRGNRIRETISDLEKIIILSKRYKFRTIFFINPIHKTTYLGTNFINFLQFKKSFVVLSDYYDFSGLNPVTSDNYYYYETSHYRKIVGEMIKDRIFMKGDEGLNRAGFGVYVTKKNIDEHLLTLEQELNVLLH